MRIKKNIAVKWLTTILHYYMDIHWNLFIKHCSKNIHIEDNNFVTLV